MHFNGKPFFQFSSNFKPNGIFLFSNTLWIDSNLIVKLFFTLHSHYDNIIFKKTARHRNKELMRIWINRNCHHGRTEQFVNGLGLMCDLDVQLERCSLFGAPSRHWLTGTNMYLFYKMDVIRLLFSFRYIIFNV